MEPLTATEPVAADARSRLIEAGLDVFGELGYAAASTRLLAERAGTNLAAIPYYFGGKEGLYRAVIQHIADHLQQRVLPPLAVVRQQLQAGALDALAAQAALEGMLGGMVDFIVGTPQARRFARIVVREQMDPSAAFDIVYDGVWQPALQLATELLARVLGEASPSRRTMLHAYALIGQVVVFRASRETIVRFMGLTGYAADETAEIREVVLRQTRATLAGLKADMGGQA